MLHVFTPSTLRKCLVFSILLIGASVLIETGCRNKETIIGPNPDSTGHWFIALEDTDALYITVVGSDILGDTIDVRLYNPQGTLAVNQLLRFSVEADTGHVTSIATTTDTLSRPYGCNPALYYWGDGNGDQENPIEIFHAYYIDNATHDTLAHKVASFIIRHRS